MSGWSSEGLEEGGRSGVGCFDWLTGRKGKERVVDLKPRDLNRLSSDSVVRCGVCQSEYGRSYN